jgi:NADPH:quinone reductase-like Zn-dependent oxidoreductase
MIYGASGSVGTFAVQIAKSFGSTVTGVASGANQELVTSLGADLVLDYTTEEFASHDRNYDLIFDTVGKLSKADKKRFLKEKGIFISNMATTKELTSLLDEIRELVESEKMTTVIDREYSMDEIAEAYKYVKTGRKKGNVVLNITE